MVRRTKPFAGSLFEHPDAETESPASAPVNYVNDRDGLPAQVIKPHSFQKYERIRQYVEICAAVRRRWKEEYGAAATFIDLYCGPGRVIEDGTGNRFPGSPLLAWDVSCQPFGPGGDTRFSHVFLGDAQESILNAATQRLREAGAPVTPLVGTAEENVDRLVAQLPPGFHLALLDPFSLSALPFRVLETLAGVEHLDMLVHFSEYDLRLNLDFNISGKISTLDPCIPGWRDVVDVNAPAKHQRLAVFNRWCEAVQSLKRPARGYHTVKRGGNVVYYLVLFSEHELAKKFWDALDASQDQMRFI